MPVTVAVEVDYLLRDRASLDAARVFLSDLRRGYYVAEPVTESVLARAVEIDEQHADADLGLVDASVIATAEHLEANAILTLDHARFRLAAPGIPLEPGENEL